MRREALLAAALLAVVVATLLLAAAAPSSLADPTDDVARPGITDVREVTIAAGSVSGETATLQVTTALEHRGGPAANVTVETRAVGLDSGLVATTRRVELGTITTEGEVETTVNLSVPREGGYRIETVLYQDGRRVDETARSVRGVGTLKPAYAQSDVEFSRFTRAGRASLPSVQYSIADVSGNRTTLEIAAYLTNLGDDPSGELRVQFVVRQADSNIVAARSAATVGEIRPGRTAAPSTEVTVPDGYNYYLDALLWKDGVIVDTTQSVANLAPTERIRANTSVRTVGLRVGDFEEGAGGPETPAAVGTEPGTALTGGQPGFGFGAVIACLVLLLGLSIRRRDQP